MRKKIPVISKYLFFDLPYNKITLNQKTFYFCSYLLAGKNYHKEEKIIKDLEKILADDCRTILSTENYFDIKKLRSISLDITTYPANIRDGYYLSDKMRQKGYKWLLGRCLEHCSPYRRYAIRFDSDVSNSQIQQHAVKVIKRHGKRILRYVNQKN